ncbi:hypothetical protein COY90_00485 [Candidatus Roizmanbacteria bacterium CG_4_10_14_0_8_um_filter_39_9]|uniref:Type 4 fimbrial biogenesis protein PilX N-terminal domain-containing protein n=1 Tax=Candidatus Roizmanbacteria bacterium CG_4_10_14_0_8_um_filter_39_9 TaxID=1974829 RepID=A0A2M7QE15_9BACT|nr:MAG: hypothetical protein COY90_00485 [Candidatus Roizmanbacteria bacterium CG_4_10_14_0_8_um_filter_39_9]
MKNHNSITKRGSTLITLLVFMIVALSVATTAVAILITNSQSGSMQEQGTEAYSAAESGIENAIIQLLRNPNYTGETLSVGSNQAVVVVSGTSPYTVTSTGTRGNYTRKVQAIIDYTDGTLTITSWKEIQ